MKKAKLFGIGLTGILAAAAWAQQPSLPPGHPSLPGQPAPSGQLPPGHPGINGVAASTRPAAKFGTVLIRTFQATKGAPALGPTKARLELYHRGQLLMKLEGTVDSNGSLMFAKLPLDLPFQPVLKVEHAGVEYTAVGDMMDGYSPNQQLELPVYEVTAAAPAWDVEMRHVMVEPNPDGIRVSEMLIVGNPTDRTWLGAPQKDGSHVSFVLALPAGASAVQFGNGADDRVKFQDGKVINALPLQPGSTQYEFSYVVPVSEGKARLDITAPATVKHLMVFAMENGGTITAEGLQPGGKHDMGAAKAQIFGGTDLKAGQVAAINIALPKAQKKTATSAAQLGGGAEAAKWVAGIGGTAVLVVGTGWVMFKPARSADIARIRRASAPSPSARGRG